METQRELEESLDEAFTSQKSVLLDMVIEPLLTDFLPAHFG